MSTSPQPTLGIQELIISYIRAGGFDTVAAEAAGVPLTTYRQWLEQGAREADGPCRDFHDEIWKAKAQARLKAEVDLREQNTLAWLRFGPGREAGSRPGWTGAVRHDSLRDRDDPDRLRAQVFDLLGKLLEILRPYPEVYEKVRNLIDTGIGD